MPSTEVTRSDLRRELAVNAVTKPVNVAVGAAVAVAGILMGATWLAVLGVVIYGVLALLTFFDGDEAERVGQEVYGRRPGELGTGADGQRDLRSYDPAIAAQLEQARTSQAAIVETIARSDLPFGEVAPEVQDLGRAMDSLATRAQRVRDYLDTQNRGQVERRLAELEASATAGSEQAIEALRQQAQALGKLEGQLESFHAKMEGIVASLGAINAEIVRLAVASEDAGETEVADRVRSLREQVDAASEGLSAAYASRADAAT